MLVRTPLQNTAWILLPPCSGAFGGSRCSQNEGRNPPHRSPLHTILPSLVSLSVLCPLSSSSSVPFLCHRTLTDADPPAGASRSSLPTSPLSDLSSGKTDPTPDPRQPLQLTILSSYCHPSFHFTFAWWSVMRVCFSLWYGLHVGRSLSGFVPYCLFPGPGR